MNKVWDAIDWLFETLAALVFASATLIIFLQIILRYVFNSPLMWAEELARIMFVWIVYMGAPIVVKRKANIEVDYLVQYLPYIAKRYLKITFYVIMSLFLLFVAYEGAIMISEYAHMSAYTLHISQAVWYFPIAFGSFMMVVNLIRVLPEVLREIE